MNSTSKRPVIGITLDHESKQTYSRYPWYALRENYANAIEQSGGIPLMLPYNMSCIQDYAVMLDGLVLTGGDFDIDPSFYGEQITSERVTIKDTRTKFEVSLLQAMMKKNSPILGICAGQQLMNVIMGGNLIQHIPDEVNQCLEHEQKTDKHLPSHSIKITQGSLLHKITNSLGFFVNSTHHQAVKSTGKNLFATAVADDGVIEAIESPNFTFFLGVQWHPEYLTTEQDKMIFSGFISACKKTNKE